MKQRYFLFSVLRLLKAFSVCLFETAYQHLYTTLKLFFEDRNVKLTGQGLSEDDKEK